LIPNIITAFLKKELKVVKRVSDYLEFFDRLTINIISYYEILRGLKDLGNVEKLKKFEEFVQANELVSIRKETIVKASEIYAYLKKQGNLIEDADILMASIAIVEDLVRITNNIKHFERIESLATENWLAD
jgi:predicted nucleic acid-binding protein